MFNQPIVMLDFETTGLSPAMGDRITEVAALRIVDGKGTQDDLHRLKAVAGQIEGHTICAFGEAAAWPVQGFLYHYWHEFEYYVEHGRSIVDGPAETVTTGVAA